MNNEQKDYIIRLTLFFERKFEKGDLNDRNEILNDFIDGLKEL